MKKPSQYFRLLLLELQSLPFLWLFIAVIVLLHASSLYVRYWFGMDMDLWLAKHESGFEDMFTLMVVIYAGTFLFPSGKIGQAAPNPPEFMLTRAIDRKRYFGAKETVFLLLVLTPIAVHTVYAIFEPDIVLASRDNTMSERAKLFMAHFPNMQTQPGDGEFQSRMIVPGGRIVYAGYKFWTCALLALGTLGWTTWALRYQLRFPVLAWLAPIITIIPFFLMLAIGNTLFALYLSHSAITIALIVLVGFGIYKFCEREFVQTEVL